jgi:peptidoglycan/LPS O-acetylase OafA/YrhL
LLLASLLDLLVLSFQNDFSFLFVFGFGSSLTLIDPSLLNNIFRTDQFFMFDQAFWTIFIEMAFYILYGIFNTIPIASLKKNSTNFLISYLTVGQMISILLLHFGTKLNIFINYIFFPEWSPYFIMGIFFAKLKSKFNFRQGVYIILITTVITIMVEVRILRVEDHRPNNVIIPTIISLLWIILKSESNLKSFLSKFVGEPSYGTYVLHQNLSIIFFEHIQSQTVKFYSVLFYFMFLLVVCRWIHLQIEAPLIKSLRKHLLGTESRSKSVG